MRGRPDCPKCSGLGYTVQGSFPFGSATPCLCARGQDLSGIPKRYADVTLDTFRRWWLARHRGALDTAEAAYLDTWSFVSRMRSGKAEVESELDEDDRVLLLRLAPFYPNGYEPTPGRLADTVLPLGLAEALQALAQPMGATIWIQGPSQSGKTSLAVALLRARCADLGGSGVYASVLALGDSLKSYHARTVGAGTWEDRKQMVADPREIYGPLLEPDCLVLDMIDSLPPENKRVAEHFVALLVERDAAAKTTIVTALDTPGRLWASGKHPFCYCDQPGVLAMSRLDAATQMRMLPALSALLDQK